jgi:hypothetical protein
MRLDPLPVIGQLVIEHFHGPIFLTGRREDGYVVMQTYSLPVPTRVQGTTVLARRRA